MHLLYVVQYPPNNSALRVLFPFIGQADERSTRRYGCCVSVKMVQQPGVSCHEDATWCQVPVEGQDWGFTRGENPEPGIKWNRESNVVSIHWYCIPLTLSIPLNNADIFSDHCEWVFQIQTEMDNIALYGFPHSMWYELYYWPTVCNDTENLSRIPSKE